jgi:ribosomal protein S27AE
MSKRKRDEQITNEKAKKILLDYAIEGCGYCHQGGKEIEISFMMAAEALEKQIPKKPYIDNKNGVYEKEYCPTCHRSVFLGDHHCTCGQALDWSEDNENQGRQNCRSD